jgi:carbon monoxide dehydrogenase subunit G
MPGFTLTDTAAAPVEDVWKLLFDPARFPEWWAGIETVRVGAEGALTVWQSGYPDFPLPQNLRTDPATGRVTMSCQTFDVEVSWQLAEQGEDTRITVIADMPADLADLVGVLEREVAAASLTALVRLAEAEHALSRSPRSR